VPRCFRQHLRQSRFGATGFPRHLRQAPDPGTLLALAKANKIPIPFDCQVGECASCVVEVQVLGESSQPFSLTVS
jgi:ferredoxin